MASARPTLLQRALVGLLAIRRGPVQARKDAKELEGVLRFSATFAATILVPALLLAYLAIASSSAEDLRFDAELRTRGGVALRQIQSDIAKEFALFEDNVRRGLQRGDLLDDPESLQAFAQAAFRFDSDGDLVEPFRMEIGDGPRSPTRAWSEAFDQGLRAEATGDFDQAERAYERASTLSRHEALIGEARYAQGRAMARTGRVREAELLLADVFAEYATLRDRAGFRLGDLVLLKRAELTVARDPAAGAVALKTLVDRMLEGSWSIRRMTDAAVARRALTAWAPLASPQDLTLAQARVARRFRAQVWTQDHVDDLIKSRGPNFPHWDVQYSWQPRKKALWASVYQETDQYVFGLDADRWTQAIRKVLEETTRRDADLEYSLAESDRPDDVLVELPLYPWLPSLALVVTTKNPEALAAVKSQRSTTRLLIIALAVLVVGFGIVQTSRVVVRELAAAREKTDFAANVSHELRSPITQISLKAESLKYGLYDNDDEKMGLVEAIVRETERLSKLVDNVLDFAAIERGTKHYAVRPEDLVEVLYNTTDSALAAIEEADCVLESDIPSDLPAVWMDRDAIAQVFTNLLSNAAKYGADGGWIGLKARVTGDQVEVRVSDKGMGISQAELPQVFDHFFRSTDPRVRQRKGTGIGLSIVRYIVEAHRGTITVDSTEGKGTTFTVLLPLTPPPGQAGA